MTALDERVLALTDHVGRGQYVEPIYDKNRQWKVSPDLRPAPTPVQLCSRCGEPTAWNRALGRHGCPCACDTGHRVMDSRCQDCGVLA